MNKVKLLNIMQELISLYLRGELSEDAYEKIIIKFDLPNITENIIAYRETEFLCFIFENIPYYQVLYSISSFLDVLKTFNPLDKNANILFGLIESYMIDLLPCIIKRTNMETQTHIQRLLQDYYQNDKLDPARTINLLKRNMIDPPILTSMDTVDFFSYEQLSLDAAGEEKIVLREEISKSNFDKSYDVEKSLKRLITNYYNEDSLANFREELLLILKAYGETEELTSGLLIENIIFVLDAIKPVVYKAWEKRRNRQNDDPNQISLQFLLIQKDIL